MATAYDQDISEVIGSKTAPAATPYDADIDSVLGQKPKDPLDQLAQNVSSATAQRSQPNLTPEQQQAADEAYKQADIEYSKQPWLDRTAKVIKDTASNVSLKGVAGVLSGLGQEGLGAGKELINQGVDVLNPDTRNRALYSPDNAFTALNSGLLHGLGQAGKFVTDVPREVTRQFMSPENKAAADLQALQENQALQQKIEADKAKFPNNQNIFDLANLGGNFAVPMGEVSAVTQPLKNIAAEVAVKGIQGATGTAAFAGKSVPIATKLGVNLVPQGARKIISGIGRFAESSGPGWLDAVQDMNFQGVKSPLGTSAVEAVIKNAPTQIDLLEQLTNAGKKAGMLTADSPLAKQAYAAGIKPALIDGVAQGSEKAVTELQSQLDRINNTFKSAKKLYQNNLDGTFSSLAARTFVNGIEGGLVVSGLSAGSQPTTGKTDYSEEFETGAALSAPFSVIGGTGRPSLKEQAGARQFEHSDYGTPTDKIHNQVMDNLSPQEQTAIDQARNNVPRGTQVYALDGQTFKQRTGSDAGGAFVQKDATNGDKPTVYLNADAQGGPTSYLHHEDFHAIENQAGPGSDQAMRQTVKNAFGDEGLKAMDEVYTSQLGEGAPKQGEKGITKEILADSFASLMQGKNPNELGLPKQLSDKVGDMFNDFISKVSGKKTPLGFDYKPSVARTAESFARQNAPEAFAPQKDLQPPETPPSSQGGAAVPPPQGKYTTPDADVMGGIRQKLYDSESKALAEDKRTFSVRSITAPKRAEGSAAPDVLQAAYKLIDAEKRGHDLGIDEIDQVINHHFNNESSPAGKEFYNGLSKTEKEALHDFLIDNPQGAFEYFSTDPKAEAEKAAEQAKQDAEYVDNRTSFQKELDDQAGKSHGGPIELPKKGIQPGGSAKADEPAYKGGGTGPIGYNPTDGRIRPVPAEIKPDVEGKPVLNKSGKPYKTTAAVRGSSIDLSGTDPFQVEVLKKGIDDKAEARAKERNESRPNETPITAEQQKARDLENVGKLNDAIAKGEVLTGVYDHAAEASPKTEGAPNPTPEERRAAQKIRSEQDTKFSQDGVESFRPKSLFQDSKGDLHVSTFSINKLLQNFSTIMESAKANGVPVPDLTSEQLAALVRRYGFLHSQGFKGDGTPVEMGALQGERAAGGEKKGLPPKPVAEFAREAQRLALTPEELDLVALAHGTPEYEGVEGNKANLRDEVEKAEFADANNMRQNGLRDAFNQKGVDIDKALNSTIQTLKLNRLVRIVKPGDTNIPEAIRAQDMRQKMFGREIVGKELPNPKITAINYSPQVMPTHGEPTIPETADTLREQQKAVIDGRQKAMLYPDNTEVLKIPKNSGLKEIKTDAGTFHYNPDEIKGSQILKSVEDGKLNEVLGMGPQSKSDAIAESQRTGIPAVAVTEQTPNGTEVKTAITSQDKSNPALQEMTRNKASENTVSIKNPAEVIQGRMYSPQIKSPEFQKWFGDSKVVDEKGKPLVVYHGTKNTVSQFDPEREGTNSNVFGSWKTKRSGIFFSESPELANEFTGSDSKQSGANVIPTHLSIKDPVDLRNGFPDHVLNELEKEGLNPRYYYRLGPSDTWEAFDHENGGKEFVNALKKIGYDGARISEPSEGNVSHNDSWVAFDPTQIKSATGNSGEFNPNNPDIRFSPGGVKRYNPKEMNLKELGGKFALPQQEKPKKALADLQLAE